MCDCKHKCESREKPDDDCCQCAGYGSVCSECFYSHIPEEHIQAVIKVLKISPSLSFLEHRQIAKEVLYTVENLKPDLEEHFRFKRLLEGELMRLSKMAVAEYNKDIHEVEYVKNKLFPDKITNYYYHDQVIEIDYAIMCSGEDYHHDITVPTSAIFSRYAESIIERHIKKIKEEELKRANERKKRSDKLHVQEKFKKIKKLQDELKDTDVEEMSDEEYKVLSKEVGHDDFMDYL